MRNDFLLSNFSDAVASVEERKKKFIWVRQNVYMVCPFCVAKQKENAEQGIMPKEVKPQLVRFTEKKQGAGIGICSNPDCGQAYDFTTMPVYDVHGQRLTEDYLNYPEDIKHLFKDSLLLFKPSNLGNFIPGCEDQAAFSKNLVI